MFSTKMAALAAFVGLALMSGAASAQENWPERAIKLVVPFGAGGGTDLTARILQKAIDDQSTIGQPITIVNVPGAAGSIGAREVLNAKPDGYTIMMHHVALLSRQAAGLTDFGYEDFEPIAGTVLYSHVLAVQDDSPYQTIGDLLDAAAAAPDTLVMGANLGGNTHMIGLMLEDAKPGADLRIAQIGGDADNFAALAGKQIDVAAFSASSYQTFEGSNVRALAMLNETRWPTLPDLPTATEQGIPVSYSHYMYWLAPKGTPVEVTDKIGAALKAALEDPEVRKSFEARYSDPAFLNAEELEARMAAQYDWIEPYAKRSTQK